MAQGIREAEAAPALPTLHIPSLDGIRAIAFLIVFIAHARLGSPFPGNFGVTLFFFLSGYLITTRMRIEFAQSGGVSLRHFYLRRTFRIFPPYYLILGVTTVLIAAGYFVGEVLPLPVAMQSIYLTNYQLIVNGYEGFPLGTYAYWSLAVEEHFYLAFPLLYLALRKRGLNARKQALVLAGLCVAVLAWRSVLVFLMDVSVDRTYIATDTRIDSILFGCILAIYGNPVLEANRLTQPRTARVLCIAAGAVLLATFVTPSYWFRESIRYSIQGVALFPLFVAAIHYADRGAFRLLNLGAVRFVGALSYSLYLVHEIAIYNIYDRLPLPRVVEAGAALTASFLVAMAIYFAVERPLAAVRRRLQGRQAVARPAPVPAVATAD